MVVKFYCKICGNESQSMNIRFYFVVGVNKKLIRMLFINNRISIRVGVTSSCIKTVSSSLNIMTYVPINYRLFVEKASNSDESCDSRCLNCSNTNNVYYKHLYSNGE